MQRRNFFGGGEFTPSLGNKVPIRRVFMGVPQELPPTCGPNEQLTIKVENLVEKWVCQPAGAVATPAPACDLPAGYTPVPVYACPRGDGTYNVLSAQDLSLIQSRVSRECLDQYGNVTFVTGGSCSTWDGGEPQPGPDASTPAPAPIPAPVAPAPIPAPTQAPMPAPAPPVQVGPSTPLPAPGMPAQTAPTAPLPTSTPTQTPTPTLAPTPGEAPIPGATLVIIPPPMLHPSPCDAGAWLRQRPALGTPRRVPLRRGPF